MAKTEKTFEEQIAELEKTVARLEDGDVSLDESLSLFESGIKLTKSCQKMLDNAEKRVKVLMKTDDGEMSEEDFINDGE
ncbi:MAG: exodeoxyribonuclease VII small subunit [Firmicutes bacterium]|nr:exodeoxyribonuclease VII small subunit [Bacillota bacterium]